MKNHTETTQGKAMQSHHDALYEVFMSFEGHDSGGDSKEMSRWKKVCRTFASHRKGSGGCTPLTAETHPTFVAHPAPA